VNSLEIIDVDDQRVFARSVLLLVWEFCSKDMMRARRYTYQGWIIVSGKLVVDLLVRSSEMHNPRNSVYWGIYGLRPPISGATGK